VIVGTESKKEHNELVEEIEPERIKMKEEKIKIVLD